jgi:hypothetical protein
MLSDDCCGFHTSTALITTTSFIAFKFHKVLAVMVAVVNIGVGILVLRVKW